MWEQILLYSTFRRRWATSVGDLKVRRKALDPRAQPIEEKEMEQNNPLVKRSSAGPVLVGG